MIDYRDLLKRYIAHVGNEEGVTFIQSARCNNEDPDVDEYKHSWVKFTPEELDELEKLDQETRT